MKKRKAVVLYGSLTGNTEQVGRAFAEVLEEYGFEVRCEKLVAGKDWSDDPVIFWRKNKWKRELQHLSQRIKSRI